MTFLKTACKIRYDREDLRKHAHPFCGKNVLFQRHNAIIFNKKETRNHQALKGFKSLMVATKILFLVCNATTAN